MPVAVRRVQICTQGKEDVAAPPQVRGVRLSACPAAGLFRGRTRGDGGLITISVDRRGAVTARPVRRGVSAWQQCFAARATEQPGHPRSWSGPSDKPGSRELLLRATPGPGARGVQVQERPRVAAGCVGVQRGGWPGATFVVHRPFSTGGRPGEEQPVPMGMPGRYRLQVRRSLGFDLADLPRVEVSEAHDELERHLLQLWRAGD